DPNDPTKGYEVPNVPTNPGEDTPINYVANKANLVVKYVDEKGKTFFLQRLQKVK
ncbi:hypothetical protein D065_11252, partial [Streptococcus mitis 13/39]